MKEKISYIPFLGATVLIIFKTWESYNLWLRFSDDFINPSSQNILSVNGIEFTLIIFTITLILVSLKIDVNKLPLKLSVLLLAIYLLLLVVDVVIVLGYGLKF